MKRLWIVCLLLSYGSGWGAPQSDEGGGSSPLVLSTRVSKTAIYVGDVFEYRISVRHSAELSFVTEELEERLVVLPFELLDFRVDQKEVEDGSLLEIVLRLVCFEKPGILEIPSLDLFYYPSQSLSQGRGESQQDVPAQALLVPIHRIKLQSSLLGEGDRLRDAVVLVNSPRSEFILPALSAAVLLVAVVGLAFMGRRHLLRLRHSDDRIEEEQVRKEALLALRNLERRGGSNGTQAVFFLEISQVLRGYLEARYGFFCQSLTPEEIGAELPKRNSDPEFAEEVEALLEGCDDVFYSQAASPAADLAAFCERAANLLKLAQREH